MAKHKRKCIVCGKEYEYCPSCPGHDPAWKLSYDNENCREIYKICAGYSLKTITVEEACKRIAKCDLSDRAHFTDSTQKIIAELEEIMAQQKEEEKPKQYSAPVKQINYNGKKEFRKKNK